MACSMRSTCPLFPVFALRASLRTWQINYCEADHTRCERFKSAEIGREVPREMLPNGKMLPVLKPNG